MGADTKIEWAHHSFNPWTGCQAVSPACDFCYAEAQAKRSPKTFGGWGPHAERKRTSESYWRQPLKWNAEARKAGTRPRVFCASMADVFDNQVPAEWRRDLWVTIAATPHLDWLLLTKRPQNIARMLPTRGWGDGVEHAPNIWLGTTVENQAEADRRIPHLLAAPAAKRFLSCEPLLGPLDLRRIRRTDPDSDGWHTDVLSSSHFQIDDQGREHSGDGPRDERIDWIIAGGESGPHARPSHPEWFRSIRDQCQDAGVRFFFKQWGEWREADESELPDRFGHPTCDQFRCISSCGFVGDLSIGSAMLHKPRSHPQCFPDGEGGDAACSTVFVRRAGKKAAGATLDGREWREVPT